MPDLPADATLADLQRYVAEMELERGFADQSTIEKCLLLGEEVGELFKAVRTDVGLAVDDPGEEIAGELADVVIYLCSIANRCDVDLDAAFRAKEAINATRRWR